jgi:hypothetical protein
MLYNRIRPVVVTFLWDLFHPWVVWQTTKGFLPHLTNSILQQLKRKLWKIDNVLDCRYTRALTFEAGVVSYISSSFPWSEFDLPILTCHWCPHSLPPLWPPRTPCKHDIRGTWILSSPIVSYTVMNSYPCLPTYFLRYFSRICHGLLTRPDSPTSSTPSFLFERTRNLSKSRRVHGDTTNPFYYWGGQKTVHENHALRFFLKTFLCFAIPSSCFPSCLLPRIVKRSILLVRRYSCFRHVSRKEKYKPKYRRTSQKLWHVRNILRI